MELDFQHQKEIPNRVSSPEEIVPTISTHRTTRGKNISSMYSNLIPKGKDKVTEPMSVQEQIISTKSENVFLFIAIY